MPTEIACGGDGETVLLVLLGYCLVSPKRQLVPPRTMPVQNILAGGIASRAKALNLPKHCGFLFGCGVLHKLLPVAGYCWESIR